MVSGTEIVSTNLSYLTVLATYYGSWYEVLASGSWDIGTRSGQTPHMVGDRCWTTRVEWVSVLGVDREWWWRDTEGAPDIE